MMDVPNRASKALELDARTRIWRDERWIGA